MVLRLGIALAVFLALASQGHASPLLQQSDVFVQGQDGYIGYRAPAMVIAPDGTMLAFADGKQNSIFDETATDLVLKRSTDGGQTWQSLQVVAASSNGIYVGSATPVVDRQTGAIVVPFLEDGQVFVTRSTNSGATWSPPVDINASLNPSGSYYATGPGHGIQLDSNRLVFTNVRRDTKGNTGASNSGVFYSDDGGQTFSAGGSVPTANTNEAAIVQKTNGDLYMNMRSLDPLPYRMDATSTDGGATWTAAQSNYDLPDSSVAGSLARLSTTANSDANRILFANPANPTDRTTMTMRVSHDEGSTFPASKVIYWGRSAYSDMAVSANQTVNLLYERGRWNTPGNLNTYQTITLAQVNQEFLEGPTNYQAQWNFNEQTSGAAPSTDGSIRDSSGWDMHAQAIGAPTYVPGPPGGGSALHFAGGQYVTLDHNDTSSFFNYNQGTSFTIQTMFRTTAHGPGGGAGDLISVGQNYTQSMWSLMVQDGKLHFRIADAVGGFADLTSGISVNDGGWHDVAAVRDGPNRLLKLYIDSKLAAVLSDPTYVFNDYYNIFMGQWYDGQQSFIGDIDYVRYLQSALIPMLLGDMNGDGVVDNFDIGAFNLALTNLADYRALYPSLVDYVQRGDLNGDGQFNNFDIGSFYGLLTTFETVGTSVPEPGSVALLGIGASVLTFLARRRSARRSA